MIRSLKIISWMGLLLMTAFLSVKGQSVDNISLNIFPDLSKYIIDYENGIVDAEICVENSGQGFAGRFYIEIWHNDQMVAQTDCAMMPLHYFEPGETCIQSLELRSGDGGFVFFNDFDRQIGATGMLPAGRYEFCIQVCINGNRIPAPVICSSYYLTDYSPAEIYLPAMADTLEGVNPFTVYWSSVSPTLDMSSSRLLVYVLEAGLNPQMLIEGSIPIISIDAGEDHHATLFPSDFLQPTDSLATLVMVVQTFNRNGKLVGNPGQYMPTIIHLRPPESRVSGLPTPPALPETENQPVPINIDSMIGPHIVLDQAGDTACLGKPAFLEAGQQLLWWDDARTQYIENQLPLCVAPSKSTCYSLAVRDSNGQEEIRNACVIVPADLKDISVSFERDDCGNLTANAVDVSREKNTDSFDLDYNGAFRPNSSIDFGEVSENQFQYSWNGGIEGPSKRPPSSGSRLDTVTVSNGSGSKSFPINNYATEVINGEFGVLEVSDSVWMSESDSGMVIRVFEAEAGDPNPYQSRGFEVSIQNSQGEEVCCLCSSSKNLPNGSVFWNGDVFSGELTEGVYTIEVALANCYYSITKEMKWRVKSGSGFQVVRAASRRVYVVPGVKRTEKGDKRKRK